MLQVQINTSVRVMFYLIHKHPVTVFGGQVRFHRLQTQKQTDRVKNMDGRYLRGLITEEQLSDPTAAASAAFVPTCRLCLTRLQSSPFPCCSVIGCPAKMSSNRSFSGSAQRVGCTYQSAGSRPAKQHATASKWWRSGKPMAQSLKLWVTLSCFITHS